MKTDTDHGAKISPPIEIGELRFASERGDQRAIAGNELRHDEIGQAQFFTDGAAPFLVEQHHADTQHVTCPGGIHLAPGGYGFFEGQ